MLSDLERKVRIRMMQDEMEEKMHQMEVEESIAALMGGKISRAEKEAMLQQMENELDFKKIMLNYE